MIIKINRVEDNKAYNEIRIKSESNPKKSE